MDEQHEDFATLVKVKEGILDLVGGQARLENRFPELLKEAIDFVIDPVLTGRTRISDLDKVEKTFIGLKIEHYFRDFLGVPKGLQRDLRIGDFDVDVKNTVMKNGWMIPPESYRNADPCVLIAVAEKDGTCSLGLMVARVAYLGGPNRDKKRGVSAVAVERHVMWLLRHHELPPSRWDGMDMARFRELRLTIRHGARRAATFFAENLGRPTHRSVIQCLLFDQKDYMKRLRGNGGARDLLGPVGVELLSGAFDRERAKDLGLDLSREDFVAIARHDSPGAST